MNNITPTQTYNIRFYADDTILYPYQRSAGFVVGLQTCTEWWYDTANP